MANVQFTGIPNDLLEALYKIKLNGTQYRIILVICRFTFGFNKTERGLSETYIAKAAGMNIKQTARELRSLIQQNIVAVIKESTHTTSRTICFNQNTHEWVSNSIQGTKKNTLYNSKDTGGNELAELSRSELAYQEKTSLKTSFKESKSDYQQIVDLYNQICVSYSRVTKLSEARKKAIKVRLKDYSIEDFRKLFEIAEASDFLKGKNDRGWSGNFDWLIKDGNFAKVLDGNYSKKGKKANEQYSNGYGHVPTAEELLRD